MVILLEDINVYHTLSGSWRAYIHSEQGRQLCKGHLAQLNVWAINKETAIRRISEELAKLNIPFDFSK